MNKKKMVIKTQEMIDELGKRFCPFTEESSTIEEVTLKNGEEGANKSNCYNRHR